MSATGAQTKKSLKRIVIADDDIDLCELVKARLEETGAFEVRCVHSGLALLSLIKNGTRPDLLILDMRMPERSGFELLASIKAAWMGTKIVVFTGFEGSASEVRDHVNLFLLKSADLSDLIDAVKKITGRE